jgi:hypothetical protein
MFRRQPAVGSHVVSTLERAGFIARPPGVARGIKMLIDPQQLTALR